MLLSILVLNGDPIDTGIPLVSVHDSLNESDSIETSPILKEKKLNCEIFKRRFRVKLVVSNLLNIWTIIHAKAELRN